MSAELDIGQIPDRPATPSTSSEVSQQYSEAKPRVTRDEDLADGETKPASESNSEAKSPAAAGGTEEAPRKKNKRPTVDYVRPEVAPNKNKLSTEALDALMERMRLKNDRIREQRERVTADEEEFYQRIKKDREAQSKAREEQRAHDAAQREAQAGIDLEREANAKRKLEKKTAREWDAEKKERTESSAAERGRGGGRGRGRGRGGGMRADGLADSWVNDPGERTWGAIESNTPNQGSSGAGDGGWGAPAPSLKSDLSKQKNADVELDGWAQPIKSADPDDWGNATAGGDDDWGNITSPHATPQDEAPQRESKPRGGGRGGGKRGKGEESRGGRGGGRGHGEKGGDRGGRGRGEGKGRGGRTFSDAPPKLPEIPVSSTEEVDWAKAAGGA